MLTDVESAQLAGLLERMGEHVTEVGRVPLNVFNALWKNTIMGGADLSVIRLGPVPEILLALRPENDPFAGLWHIPGTRVLLGDDAFSSMEKRVMKRDFGVVLPRKPEFLLQRDIMKGSQLGRDHSPVGQEFYRAYQYVLGDSDPEILTSETMKFFPLNTTPENFLTYQLPTIELLWAMHSEDNS